MFLSFYEFVFTVSLYFELAVSFLSVVLVLSEVDHREVFDVPHTYVSFLLSRLTLFFLLLLSLFALYLLFTLASFVFPRLLARS